MLAEPGQRDHRYIRLAHPWRLELRPERDTEQHRQMRHPRRDDVEELERRRIDPVDNVKDQQYRSLAGMCFQLANERLQGQLTLSLGVESEPRIPGCGRQAQEIGE